MDRQQLDARYQALQQKFHPDRFANKPAKERQLSLQYAAYINEAYQVLKSPLWRARYLLEQSGLQFDETTETQFDEAFLMEQIELRESLSEISSANEPLSILKEFLLTINGKITSMLEDFSTAFSMQQNKD